MVEIGECSGTKPSEETWAILVPLNEKYSVIELTSDEVAIYSEILPSSSEKHVWCKITRNPDLCSATLHCLSSTAVLVDGVALHNKGDVSIRSGSEIFAAPDTAGNLSYRFEVMPTKDYCKQQLKICLDADHVKCSICLNVWHDAVTVAPCLHNFCNGCFSEWLRRSQEKHTNVLCPQCRAVVQFVGRNHFLHTIVEDILKTDESLQRSDEEFAVLDSYATIKSNLVITTEKTRHQKRARPSSDVEYDSMDLPCPQCGRELGGFRCSQTTVHLPCQACGGLMPSRPNISVPQHCVGCDRAFCGAYWHAQWITQSNTHTHSLCNRETLKPIVERTVSRIPSVAHESNQHEQEITERCITQMGRAVQSVISEWIVKLNNREIDRAKLPLKNAETITSATHVCNDCYDKLVSFLLYWFRISIPKYHLPPDVAKREDCWYGYGCRTQHHNEDHARKRNHVCRPTRGS